MQSRCSSGKAIQLEEKVSRLEQERAELMITIQKGEGFDTAIQQLQQDNVSSVYPSLCKHYSIFYYFLTDTFAR